jgi:uncharacterized protein YqgV (UPF0045/DUF77 family)
VYTVDVPIGTGRIRMKQAIVKMITEMVNEGLFLQLHGPSGTFDIDADEAISAVQNADQLTLRLDRDMIIFGDGQVCITIEDPDDHNADANNHCVGI